MKNISVLLDEETFKRFSMKCLEHDIKKGPKIREWIAEWLAEDD